MPFPKSFYKSTSGVRLQRSSTPAGGMLANDFMENISQPFVIPTPHNKQGKDKKTLVFTDHFYSQRDDNQKNAINDKLREAKADGFRILILSKTGELIDWNGTIIPDNYTLDINSFSPQAIYNEAAKLQVSADNVYLLHHFGINELLGEDNDQLNFTLFKKNPSQMLQIMRNMPRKKYKISLSLDDIKAIDTLELKEFNTISVKLFLSQREDSSISDLLSSAFMKLHLTELDFCDVVFFRNFLLYLRSQLFTNEQDNTIPFSEDVFPDDLKQKALGLILKAFPKLERFFNVPNSLMNMDSFLSFAKDKIESTSLANETNHDSFVKRDNKKINGFILLSDYFMKNFYFASRNNPKLLALKNVKSLIIENINASIIKNIQLFSEYVPSIVDLVIREFEQKIDNIKLIKLKTIKQLVICFNRENNNLEELLQATPNLIELNIQSGEVSSALTKIKPRSLLYLEKITIKAVIDLSSLIALIKAAPNLKEITFHILAAIPIDLTHFLAELTINSLSSLQKLTLSKWEASSESIGHLFILSPKLREIHLKNVTEKTGKDSKDIFETTQRSKLNNLTKVSITSSTDFLDEAGLIKLLQSTKNIETVDLTGHDINYTCLMELSANSLPYLTELHIPGTIDPQALLHLTRVAPNLKSIFIKRIDRWAEASISFDFNKMPGEGLPNHANYFIDLLPPNSLPHLKKLHSDLGPISPNQYNQLLRAAPNLEIDFNTPYVETEEERSIREDLEHGNEKSSSSHEHNLRNSASNEYQSRKMPATNTMARHNAINLNTAQNKNNVLSWINYFPDSKFLPRDYRLIAYYPEDLSLKAVLTDFKSYEIKPNQQPNLLCHRGRKPVTPVDGDRVILPSLSPEEELASIRVIDHGGHLIDPTFIKYCKKTRFYQITLPKQGDYTIEFELNLPSTPKQLPKTLKDLEEKYDFDTKQNIEKQSPVKNPPKAFKDYKELVDYIRKTYTGSCQHRALAAYDEIKNDEKYRDILNYHIITNHVHAFVEVETTTGWYKLELGGYDTKLEEDTLPDYKQKNSSNVKKPQSNTAISTTSLKEETLDKAYFLQEKKGNSSEVGSKEDAKTSVLNTTAKEKESESTSTTISSLSSAPKTDNRTSSFSQPTKEEKTSAITLLQIESVEDIQYFLSEFTASSEKIYVAHKLQDLSLSGSEMTASGDVLLNQTPFKRWLQNRTHGTIYIDIRQFEQHQIAQLNDLLDKKLRNELPEGISIKILDNQNQSYSPDFERRVTVKTKINAPSSMMVLPEYSKEKHPAPASPKKVIKLSFSKDDKSRKDEVISEDINLNDIFEIDLFGSPYWRRLLIGGWNLQEDKKQEHQHTLLWENSDLIKVLEQKDNPYKKVIIKNAPTEDPEFLTFMAELQSLRKIAWANKTTAIPNHIAFYQKSGYVWEELAKDATFTTLTANYYQPKQTPLILTDINILSFTQNSRYVYEKDHGYLTKVASHLKHCHDNKISKIDVWCDHTISEGTIALLLTKAKEFNVQVNFVLPTPNLPCDGLQPLYNAFLSRASLNNTAKNIASNNTKQNMVSSDIKQNFIFTDLKEDGILSSDIKQNVEWHIHEDVEYLARKLTTDEAKNVFTFDMSCLEFSELNYCSTLTEDQKDLLIKTGKLSTTGQLSDILKQLKNGKTVVLTGKIPPILHESLMELSLGIIENERYTGKLIILSPPEEAETIAKIIGKTPNIEETTHGQRIALLRKLYANENQIIIDFLTATPTNEMDFTQLEKAFLQYAVRSKYQRLNIRQQNTDEKKSEAFDAARLRKVKNMFSLIPWVMLPGITGIGKTSFLHSVLPKADKTETHTSLEKWLNSQPKADEQSILIIDEANFENELKGQGEHFLKRFKSLRNQPPGFLWKSKYHTLTPHHKVIFAFNPATYGMGRQESGFLHEQDANIYFKNLPNFYLRHNILKPCLSKEIKLSDNQFNEITDSFFAVYNWILHHAPKNKTLITPRHLKCMMNLMMFFLTSNKKEPYSLWKLLKVSSDIAYILGKCALIDYPNLEKQFKTTFNHNNRDAISHSDPENSRENTRNFIYQMLNARKILSGQSTDLGLGGILLEGTTGIGKSYLINSIADDLKKEKQPVVEIFSTDIDKENKLRQAFHAGAVVIIHEINTGIWPSKLLHNYMMGLDEFNQPAKIPGFFLLATQNPISYKNRYEDDPALRQRLIKLKLNWPAIQEDKKVSTNEAQNNSGEKKDFFMARQLKAEHPISLSPSKEEYTLCLYQPKQKSSAASESFSTLESSSGLSAYKMQPSSKGIQSQHFLNKITENSLFYNDKILEIFINYYFLSNQIIYLEKNLTTLFIDIEEKSSDNYKNHYFLNLIHNINLSDIPENPTGQKSFLLNELLLFNTKNKRYRNSKKIILDSFEDFLSQNSLFYEYTNHKNSYSPFPTQFMSAYAQKLCPDFFNLLNAIENLIQSGYARKENDTFEIALFEKIKEHIYEAAEKLLSDSTSLDGKKLVTTIIMSTIYFIQTLNNPLMQTESSKEMLNKLLKLLVDHPLADKERLLQEAPSLWFGLNRG